MISDYLYGFGVYNGAFDSYITGAVSHLGRKVCRVMVY